MFKSLILASTLTLSNINLVAAQITPDQTLGSEKSVVTLDQINPNRDLITGGATRGGNLFHSFSEFNINEGKEAYFNPNSAINNILTRVTGANISNINGTLGVLGNANLFLINPHGIVFGENAKLDLNGSFLGSTADRILFNNYQFSASEKNPPPDPLLTINIPLGLQLNNNPGSITINGNGSDIYNDPTTALTISNIAAANLKIKSGETLAFLGREIILNNGVIAAPDGNIQLGSVAENSQVGLIFENNYWKFNYDLVTNFADINLSKKSLIDVSGHGGGNIDIFGQNLTLTDSSNILGQLLGSNHGANINVNLQESLTLSGYPAFTFSYLKREPSSSILAENSGSGQGGDVTVNARNLLLLNGGQLGTGTKSGSGNAGNVTINVTETAKMIGFKAVIDEKGRTVGNYISAIGSDVGKLSQGNAGTITLNVGTLLMENTQGLVAGSSGAGNSGTIIVNADYVELSGNLHTFKPNKLARESDFLNKLIEEKVYVEFPGGIVADAFGKGAGGQIFINSDVLKIKNGAALSVSSVGQGQSGNIVINSAIVEIDGQSITNLPSGIFATAGQFGNLSGVPVKSQGGDIIINSDNLTVSNGAEIAVNGLGLGQAGNIEIEAKQITLDHGHIKGETDSSLGGNINKLNAEILTLKNNSEISTTSGVNEGAGNGGNININADFIINYPDNNVIKANAYAGNGGNINLNSNAIFGSQFLDITASSQLGIDGNIDINLFKADPTSGLFVNNQSGIDIAALFAKNFCNMVKDSSFVYIGRAGRILTQDDEFEDYETFLNWVENPIANPSNPPYQGGTKGGSVLTKGERGYQGAIEIVQTQGWVKLADGTIVLTAHPVEKTPDGVKFLLSNCK